MLLLVALVVACSSEPTKAPDEDAIAPAERKAALEVSRIKLAELPRMDLAAATNSYVQKLSKPTHRENAALYVRLPPTRNPKLRDSLVRVIGGAESPLVLFKSDALDKLGITKGSPGSDFFTTFIQFDSRELDLRDQGEALIKKGTFGDATNQSIVFDGRQPIGTTNGAHLDSASFDLGRTFGLSICHCGPMVRRPRGDAPCSSAHRRSCKIPAALGILAPAAARRAASGPSVIWCANSPKVLA